MTPHHSLNSRRIRPAFTLLVACLALAAQRALPADDVKPAARRANAHVHPEPLKPGDVLIDGPRGKRIEITSPTTLIWVDLAPDARFAHDTEYVLITPQGTRVVKGQWWPNLNGKDILRGEKDSRVASPIELTEK
jgi:hypothetical protein